MTRGQSQAPRVWWIDRLRKPGVSELGTSWSEVSDRVMGGVSDVRLSVTRLQEERCYRLHGRVSTANSGGFVQMVLPLSTGEGPLDASAYRAVRLRICGNGESYAVHLRTTENRAPWDVYAAAVVAMPGWRDIEIPFASFDRVRRYGSVDPGRLVQLAIVGTGRDFDADLAVAAIGLVEA